MIIGGPTTRKLGLVVLIAIGGCGSGSGRSAVPPPTAAATGVPSATEPTASSTRVTGAIESDVASPAPVLEAKEGPSPIPGFRRSFDAPLRAPAVATGDPELDLLVSYLKASFAEAIQDGGRLVIEDTTDVEMLHFRQPYQELVDGLLRQSSDQVPAEMIRDFGEKNRESGLSGPN